MSNLSINQSLNLSIIPFLLSFLLPHHTMSHKFTNNNTPTFDVDSAPLAPETTVSVDASLLALPPIPALHDLAHSSATATSAHDEPYVHTPVELNEAGEVVGVEGRRRSASVGGAVRRPSFFLRER